MTSTLKPTPANNVLRVATAADADEHIAKLKVAAAKAHKWIAEQSYDPLEFLRAVKFEKNGFHPISHHKINLIEQVNQTWTYLVALKAAMLLLEWHPEACGLTLAPGATASQELDIMSVTPGLVGAETFAATSPGSNGKLNNDLVKMMQRSENHRYVFFACQQDRYAATQRQLPLCKNGVEVWSVAI
jgi:hypothetical protein